MKEFIADKLDLNDIVIENAHRSRGHIGAQQLTQAKRRHIVARFAFRPQRFKVMQMAKTALKNSPFFVKVDLCQEDARRKASCRDVMNRLYNEGQRPVFRNGILYVNGKPYKEGPTT